VPAPPTCRPKLARELCPKPRRRHDGGIEELAWSIALPFAVHDGGADRRDAANQSGAIHVDLMRNTIVPMESRARRSLNITESRADAGGPQRAVTGIEVSRE
jgi:hypothetical protein